MTTSVYSIETDASTTRMLVRGILDFQTAPALADPIDTIIKSRATAVVVDASQLDIIDSSGVAALVKLYKGVRAYGGSMVVVGAKDQPLTIFKLLRMDKVFLQ